MTSIKPSYYDILGVQQTASEAEIRGAFKRLARKYHPDKRTSELEKFSNPQTYDDHSDALAGTGATSFDEMFSLLANAYSILSDGVKRAAYDLEIAGTKKSGQMSVSASLKRLRELRKQDAELQIKLMEVTSEQRRESEKKRSGLIFLEAWYGVAQAIEYPLKHPNEVVNVTKQLQTIVENSKLVLPKGDSKAVSIPGVYDPCPENTDKVLKVQYTFKGKLHQAIVRDDDMLLVPMKSHLVGPKSSDDVAKLSGMGDEVRILLGPGAGQIVQVKKTKQFVSSTDKSRISTALRVIGMFGIVVGVVGSIAMTTPRTRKFF